MTIRIFHEYKQFNYNKVKKLFISLLLCVTGTSAWSSIVQTDEVKRVNTSAVKTNDKHITLSSSGLKGYNVKDVIEIHECNGNCPKSHTLEWILNTANVTSSEQFDLIKINLDNTKHNVVGGLTILNGYTIDLTKVTGLTTLSSISNNYAHNILLPSSVGKIDKNAIEYIKSNFNLHKLYNVIAVDNYSGNLIALDAYINKPGFLANGLQYISNFSPYYKNWGDTWYNIGDEHNGKGFEYDAKNVRKLKVSGYVFARDIKATWEDNITAEGHLLPARENSYQSAYSYRAGKCDCELAPSKNDPNVIHISENVHGAGNGIGALLGAKITHFDFTDAEFGENVTENGKHVFKYYPADMTLSELQYFADPNSVHDVKLPTASSQYIIPEGFLHDSWFVHNICIPCNFTEIHRFAFLGTAMETTGSNHGGITRYTTTAAKDGEQLNILKGDTIDYGPKTMTLASTMKFIGKGAFSGYGGAALIEDVYVLAEKAPICEFYAFDQKTYIGQDSHKQGHLIKKGNYVNIRNGMAMLHFPNTADQREMLNYSDMTRRYRLYDETGHYDNLGNILVWPTQAQYNRSFNQAMAGVTWDAWVENLNGIDNPEEAFSAEWVAGSGDNNATHEILFPLAASHDGFTEQFITKYGRNPYSDFNSPYSGSANEKTKLAWWDDKLMRNSVATEQTDRPLSYNWKKYGGWHQFTIAELYDFMLDPPGPDPKPDYYNFAKYNRNIWYSICFPFNLTKKQLLKAFGNTETGEYPYLCTLSGFKRNASNLHIILYMSKNLLKNKILYDDNCPNTVKTNFGDTSPAKYEPVTYNDDDIVLEANRPYFILPCLPEVELIKAATGNRKSEVTIVRQENGQEKIMFPMALHVHTLDGNSTSYVDGQDNSVADTTYAYNYYFVGNYIPQEMPLYAYYLRPYQKSNGDWWSSFYVNKPKKENLMWESNEAIVFAMIEDIHQTRSKGELTTSEMYYSGKTTQNYIWNVNAWDDWVFFADTGHEAYAKSSFASPNNYTTNIVLSEDFENDNTKVYNLNGQAINKMQKGIYIKAGKKIIVK